MELKNTSLTLPIVKKNCEHVFHLYSLYHPKRGVIIKQLKEKKIEVKIYYPAPIHLMKAYKDFNKTKNSNLKMTEKVSKGIFSLPLYPNLKYKQAYKITKILKNILKNL